MPGRPDPPELGPLIAVAGALGDLCARVVFIGGAIAPLLQTRPVSGRVRPTEVVDAIAASASYPELHRLAAELRGLGFREAMDARHAHRWRAPDGTPFDLAPAGTHLGATGSDWDRLAIETATEAEMAPGVRIRHASAPAFLALKWAAYLDRGAADPFGSRDLEDILALLASRPGIEDEVAVARAEVRRFIAERSRALLSDSIRQDLLASSLGYLPGATAVIAGVERVLERMSPEG